MSIATLPSESKSAPATPPSPEELLVEPFLHCTKQEFYNPLTDRKLTVADPDFAVMRRLQGGELTLAEVDNTRLERLLTEGWIVDAGVEHAARFFLKYVSLEAHTVCNQGCYFCPVSVKRREDHFMESELYERIVAQLAEFKSTIEGVSMINYNEPTIDKRFVEQVQLIKSYGLPPAVLTNATGLTPKTVDALLEAGGVSYLSVNLSTLDRDRYAVEREGDHLRIVLRNLDYLKDKRLADVMEIAVLGVGDDKHRSDFSDIQERFAGSQFNVLFYEVMDRAGHMGVGHSPAQKLEKLRGCDQTGSRPLQWAHITPRGELVLCCQDYDEDYVLGDLRTQTLREVLSGPKIQELRRWAHGLDEAPDDFICRHCVYALSDD